MRLDGKNFAQFTIDVYGQVILPKRKQALELAHMDLEKISSHHEIEMINAVSLMEILATATGNEVQQVENLPANFTINFDR